MRAGSIQTKKLSSETSTIANRIAVESRGTHGEPVLPDKNVKCPGPTDMHIDAPSMNSEESVNGESDIDDVPDIISDGRSNTARKTWKLSQIDLVAVFQSLRYKSLSLLFGPRVCGFLVA